jgi:hypothetical protein
VYNGGSTTQPRDQAHKIDLTPYWNYGGPIAMGIFNGVGLLFVLGSITYIFLNRSTKIVQVRRGPVFEMFCIVGRICGRFFHQCPL